MSHPDHFNDPDGFRPKADKSGMSGCAKVALGCGAIVFISLIAAGIGLWWIATNAREIGADLAGTAMKEGLKELRLPADQQQRIFERIDEVAQRFKDEKITLEEVFEMFREISEGPLIPAGMALVVDRAYLEESGFDDEEKATARVTVQRFTHGTIREMIPQAEVETVLDAISTKNNNGERTFRHPVTDEELRTFIAAAKQAADDANVPEEVPKVNFADEFDKAIDEALGKRRSPVPNASPTEPTEKSQPAAEKSQPTLP